MPAQVGAVVERQQQLARRARRGEIRCARRGPATRARPARPRARRRSPSASRCVVVSGSVSRSASRLPPQAGARIGANRTDSATSRRTTSIGFYRRSRHFDSRAGVGPTRKGGPLAAPRWLRAPAQNGMSSSDGGTPLSASSGGPESRGDIPPWPPCPDPDPGPTADLRRRRRHRPRRHRYRETRRDRPRCRSRSASDLPCRRTGSAAGPRRKPTVPWKGTCCSSRRCRPTPSRGATLSLSWRWPDLSLNTSVVAMRRLQSGRLDGVYLSSGSAPRFPTRMTLFTLPMASPSITLAFRKRGSLRTSADANGCGWCKVRG